MLPESAVPAPSHPDASEPGLAIALSGGGHRAALFTLGVLKYLVDSGMNRHVEVISSVSGGSITNGFVAQECDFRTVDREAFDQIAADLVGRIVDRGLMRGGVFWTYLFLLIAGVGCTASTYLYDWPVSLPGWATVALLATVGIIALLRGHVIASAMSRLFFLKGGKHTRLADLSRSVEHLFCATDLNSNAPFIFSTWEGGSVYSPALGFSAVAGTRLAPTTLATAVRASAAFPGGIPPKRIRLGDVRYDFKRSTVEARWQVKNTKYRKAGEYRPRTLFLADGGVWNNLGTQALVEYHDTSDWASAAPWRKRVDDIRWVVADASAPVTAAPLWRLHLPLLAELSALMRSISILTFNTVDPRIERLRENRNRVVVSITDDRTRGLSGALAALHPEDAELAEWSKHGMDVEHWSELRISDGITLDALRRQGGGVATTLGRISRDDAVTLLVHGYQNAFAEIYSRFPYPRPEPRPFINDFQALLP